MILSLIIVILSSYPLYIKCSPAPSGPVTGPPSHWKVPQECQVRGSLYVCGQHTGYGCEASKYVTSTGTFKYITPLTLFIKVDYVNSTYDEYTETHTIFPNSLSYTKGKMSYIL